MSADADGLAGRQDPSPSVSARGIGKFGSNRYNSTGSWTSAVRPVAHVTAPTVCPSRPTRNTAPAPRARRAPGREEGSRRHLEKLSVTASVEGRTSESDSRPWCARRGPGASVRGLCRGGAACRQDVPTRAPRGQCGPFARAVPPAQPCSRRRTRAAPAPLHAR